MKIETLHYSKSDFASGQEVRWCPGCGDYSILSAVQKTLPELELEKEKFVFVSGIGCSSRFPYYMNTYGFHTIHGRAPAVAMGLKISNPDLSVWVVTGDGDALSIGGNHIYHLLRRNPDINVLLFNNAIYGLTKGQYSPTSAHGSVTKSSPYGSLEEPVNAASFAIGSGATFVARTADILVKHMAQVMAEGYHHEGTAFMEVLQNCQIFNNGAFDSFLDKEVREDKTIMLEHGKPMIFGKNKDKALRFNSQIFSLEVVETAKVAPEEILVHNAELDNPALHAMLSAMKGPDFPVAFGVIRRVKKPVYEKLLHQQEEDVIQSKGKGNLEELLQGRETWRIDDAVVDPELLQ